MFNDNSNIVNYFICTILMLLLVSCASAQKENIISRQGYLVFWNDISLIVFDSLTHKRAYTNERFLNALKGGVYYNEGRYSENKNIYCLQMVADSIYLDMPPTCIHSKSKFYFIPITISYSIYNNSFTKELHHKYDFTINCELYNIDFYKSNIKKIYSIKPMKKYPKCFRKKYDKKKHLTF